MKRNRPTLEPARCPTCGARILDEQAACAICGAQVTRQVAATPWSQLPHVLLSLVILLAAGAAFLWYIQPSSGLYVTPTATQTRTPWPSATYTDTPSPTITRTPTLSPTPTPFCVEYLVQENDDIALIADRFAVSAEEIRAQNRLDPDLALEPGQKLCIRVSPDLTLTPAATSTPTPFVYTVVRGDNLGSIADQFDTTVALLLEANNLSENSIIGVGQKLIIGKVYPTPTPETPTATNTPTLVPPTATPTPTGTPSRYRYVAPTLLYPKADDGFHGPEARIVLNWTAVAFLQPDEWYQVRVFWVSEEGEREVARGRTKSTSWQVPSTAYRYTSDFSAVRWDVIVLRELETGEVVAASPMSEPGSFSWY